jgi:hypothetical protein
LRFGELGREVRGKSCEIGSLRGDCCVELGGKGV